MPRSPMRAWISGVFSAATICSLSLVTMSFGTPAGPWMAFQLVNDKVGIPAFLHGRDGRQLRRSLLAGGCNHLELLVDDRRTERRVKSNPTSTSPRRIAVTSSGVVL